MAPAISNVTMISWMAVKLKLCFGLGSCINYDFNDYVKEYDKFLDKFTSFDDGHASSRIVALIIEKTDLSKSDHLKTN